MKKFYYSFLLLLTFFSGYSQFPENFEGSATNLPSQWNYYQSGTGTDIGTDQFWKITSVPSFLCDAGPDNLNTATIDRENIGDGNTSIDYLASPRFLMPANGQVRFTSKQFANGNNGSIYKLMISTNADQSVLSSYVTLQTWTEDEMNVVFNVCELKKVDIPASYSGQQVYVAFVKENTQSGAATTGDRWNVDKINVVAKCQNLTGVTTANTGVTTTNIRWSSTNAGNNWDIIYFPAGETFDGIPDINDITIANPALTLAGGVYNYSLTGLTPGTVYNYYVRSNCTGSATEPNTSDWSGPLIFITSPTGSDCNSAIQITTLPYQNVTNSGLFPNNYNFTQAAGCGATPAGTNYMAGNDVYYNYTATDTGLINISLTPTAPNSSIFIHSACSNVANWACLAGVANNNANIRQINDFAVTAGTSYIIVVSSSSANPSVGHTIVLQYRTCDPPVGNIPPAANVTESQATLTWSNPTAATNWGISVQPLGSGIPAGVGTPVSGGVPTYTAMLLTSGTQYEYWVRSECSPGVFSAWAGPYPFTTNLCADTNKCGYTFRMTDSGNNGWQGARMQVRQGGVVVQEIGSTITNGGPVNVVVQLCDNIPFDLFWSVGGTAPQQCGVSIINSFGQTLFTKPAGTGGAGFQVYDDLVNCTSPRCDIKPTAVSVVPTSIMTTSATVQWSATATTSWDIYVVIAGNPAPDETTTPTYNDVTVVGGLDPTFTFPLSGLTPDTVYNVYVRVNCSPDPSDWGGPAVFTTIPTCIKPPTFAVVPASITTNSATFNWTFGTPGDTQWQILLVPTTTTVLPTVPPSANPSIDPGVILQTVNAPVTFPHQITGLSPATIYNYYIRTICASDNISNWTTVKQFNTITCATADKCNYKIQLFNSSGVANWNGARIQIRQNGILISTLGNAGINGNAINVPICPGIPFDIFWSAEGTDPSTLSFIMINPFQDIIFTGNLDDEDALTVLYNSIGSCTPVGCQKPTAMNVTAALVGATSAQLTWTDVATTTQWEVYVTPFGEAPPVNGTPLNTSLANPIITVGTSNFYFASTQPFTVTGLIPGTRYSYYVRSICSSTETSTWTILSPFSFTTTPANDECANAISVPVSSTWTCTQGNSTIGNTLGATRSLPTIGGAGCGNSNDDVWYKFVATGNVHTVRISDILPTPSTANVALNHSVFRGTCDALVNIYCSTAGLSVATGLTNGETYYVRIYTSGSATTSSAQFTLCVGTPPPAATNDECLTAIPAVVNSLSECIVTTPGSVIGATQSTLSIAGGNPPCVGTTNDDVWFSFVANSGTEIISLQNIQGTTTNLNHAVYSGTCASLVRLNCSANNTLQTVTRNLVVGQTYYVRVWSNASISQITTFDLCIKPLSSCQTAAPFCGADVLNPYIYANTTGLQDFSQVACLGSIPNPTFYTLRVDQTGALAFNILQNTAFDAAGNPVGANLDVDFVAWGPFSNTQSCDQISLTDCPTCPFTNVNSTFYPFGNIVDCSYSGSFTETMTLPNAVAGQYYVILVTNYEDEPGFIRLVQTNFGQAGAGETVCCDVKLGPDVEGCGDSILLNALEDVVDLNNVPGTFEWFLLPSTTPIPGATGPTYLATQAGTYRVKGACGLNPVQDDIVVVLSPAIETTSVSDLRVCDDVSNDGIAPFNIQNIGNQVLGSLDPALYTVSVHLTDADANSATSIGINTTIPLNSNSTTVFVRVQSNVLASCYAVEPVNLEVISLPNAPIIADVKECELDPLQTLIPVIPAGVDIQWFDDPVAGNAIPSPSWSQVGQMTYYAESIAPNLDFTNTSTTVTIPAGQTTASVTVPTTLDTTTEQSEMYTITGVVTSTNTLNSSITGTGTILDNATSIVMSVSSPIVQEGANAEFTINLSSSSTTDIVINFVTTDGTADNIDYTPTTQSVTITAGSTSATVSVPTLTDANTESDETFTLTGTVTSGTVANSTVVATGTITETSSTPILSISNPVVVEGNSSEFMLTLSAPSSVDTVINLTTMSGTAGSLGCRSATRTPVVLEIYGLPNAPGEDTAGVFVECATNPIQTLTASVIPVNATTVTWYLDETGGTAIVGLPTLNTVGTIDYYAESVADVTLCKSKTRTKVTLQIKEIPLAPTTTMAIDRQCLANPIQTITAQATTVTDATVVWYANETDTTPIVGLPTLNTIGFVDYYAESNLDGCVSTTRTKVTLEIYPEVPMPTVDGAGQFVQCATDPVQIVTASAIAAPGTTINWYATSIGGNPTSPTYSSVGTTSYYAESVDNVTNCKSFNRLKVDLEIKIVPDFALFGDCKGSNFIIEVSPSNTNSYDPNTVTYQWKNSSGEVVGTNASMLTVTQAGTYFCTITNNNCSYTTSYDANAISCSIQKGISPKGTGYGDGLNDNFDLSSLDVSQLEIFNRYGKKVYTKDNYVDEWFGQSNNGDELPDGTYYYVIKLVNEPSKTGWIYINREK